MSSKFFLGDIVNFKNGKTLVEGKVIDLEWFPLTKKFVYTIQDKNLSEFRVGEPAVKMVPFNKRKEQW
jgi:hypothetical protein